MVSIPPPRRRRKKAKRRSATKSTKSKSATRAKAKTAKKGRKSRKSGSQIRISGVLLLGLLLCAAVSIVMYIWASIQVQEYLVRRALKSGAVMSASTIVTSPDTVVLGSVAQAERPLSKSTWSKVLTAHGYTESEIEAPKTFAFLEALSQLRITDSNKRSSLVSKSGEIFSLEAAGARLPAKQLVLEPIPLGNYQSDGERVGLAVPLAAFSPSIVAAIVAVEDERFFSHFGIDLFGIARAFVANVSAGRWVQGGSTLTQQLAKNTFLSANRSLVRKFKEVFLSLALERALTKQQLLEIYLNEVYLGSEAGNPIRGVPAAAKWLFNKSAGELTISESALIAGMIQAPSINNPRTRPENAENRRKVALQRLLDAGRITASDSRVLETDKPLLFRPSDDAPSLIPSAGLAPYVAASARKSTSLSGNTGMQTTISPPLQRCAEQAVLTGTQQIGRRLKRREKSAPPQIGFVAIDVGANTTVALVGGTNFAVNKINHATDLQRQFGSVVKPFVYLRAFEGDFTLASRLQDEPLPLGKWNPENYDHQFRGVVTARYALENSLNLPSIRVANAIGIDAIAQTFTQFGLVRTKPPAYPALAIGALEGTLFDITNGYAALARGGRYLRAQTLMVQENTPQRGEQIADERAVFLVTNALQGVVQRGTGRGLDAQDFPSIAGKTGTSDSTRDAWFVGYTPTHAIGVWVGYDNNQPLGLTGGAAATPIVGSFLRCSSELVPKRRFMIPAGVELRSLEAQGDEQAVQEFFIDKPSSTASKSRSGADPQATDRESSPSWFERWFGL